MKNKRKSIVFSLYRYFVFFVLIAFVITCCMMLFLSTMEIAAGFELTEENLSAAAKITFLNVVLISGLVTLIDSIRRKITVDIPSRKIIEAAEKLMSGDFSARVAPSGSVESQDVFDDITECFNRLAEELSGIETLREDFVANVSHELKTPLSVIKNYASLLSAPDVTEEERLEYARSISSACNDLGSLVTNILKLNKLENQQILPNKEVYDLSEQLITCLLSFESEWEKKELQLETDIEDGVTVNTDAEMMTLVWNNLFSNAIKFTENGGLLRVSLKTDGDTATVEVEDSGCGISKEVGEHIFEKFYQGDVSHSTRGNGLGLTLVKRVIDITEGEISVRSEPGVGSVFKVTMRREYTE